MFSMSYNIIYNNSCSPSPEPGQALLLFHKKCCSSSTDRAERRISSCAAISWRVAMSSIIRGDGGPWAVQNTPMYPCMSCQIVPASTCHQARAAQHPARTARNWHPARAAHARPARPRHPARAALHRHPHCLACAARHSARTARHRHPARAILHRHPARAARHRHPARVALHCIQRVLPCINERCMTVGKA